MASHAICPVCRRTVAKTQWNRIALHRDSTMSDLCPASSEPFDITIAPDDPTHFRKAG